MKERLMYVENKSGGDSGEAWIGLVSFSKSGTTIYFNGRAYRSLKGRGISANFVDIETGKQFWISGVKKRGTNRHRCGSGIIHVDRGAVSALLAELKVQKLDPSRFVVADAAPTQEKRAEFHRKQNERL